MRNGDNLTAMAVRDATLTVDFGARKFDTRIGVTGPDLNSQLSASGKFDWQGTMIADANRSTMAVVGAPGCWPASASVSRAWYARTC